MREDTFCALCLRFFKASPLNNEEGRVCDLRPMIKRGTSFIIDPINLESVACEDIEPAKSFYCPILQFSMSLRTCLNYRRDGECPKCEVGFAAVKLYREGKDPNDY